MRVVTFQPDGKQTGEHDFVTDGTSHPFMYTMHMSLRPAGPNKVYVTFFKQRVSLAAFQHSDTQGDGEQNRPDLLLLNFGVTCLMPLGVAFSIAFDGNDPFGIQFGPSNVDNRSPSVIKLRRELLNVAAVTANLALQGFTGKKLSRLLSKLKVIRNSMPGGVESGFYVPPPTWDGVFTDLTAPSSYLSYVNPPERDEPLPASVGSSFSSYGQKQIAEARSARRPVPY
jgi:hypothetical protein